MLPEEDGRAAEGETKAEGAAKSVADRESVSVGSDKRQIVDLMGRRKVFLGIPNSLGKRNEKGIGMLEKAKHIEERKEWDWVFIGGARGDEIT